MIWLLLLCILAVIGLMTVIQIVMFLICMISSFLQ